MRWGVEGEQAATTGGSVEYTTLAHRDSLGWAESRGLVRGEGWQYEGSRANLDWGDGIGRSGLKAHTGEEQGSPGAVLNARLQQRAVVEMSHLQHGGMEVVRRVGWDTLIQSRSPER